MFDDPEIKYLWISEVNRNFDKTGQEFLITQALYEGEWDL